MHYKCIPALRVSVDVKTKPNDNLTSVFLGIPYELYAESFETREYPIITHVWVYS